jgi:hypothetical protein
MYEPTSYHFWQHRRSSQAAKRGETRSLSSSGWLLIGAARVKPKPLGRPSHHDWLFAVYLRKSERAFTQIIFIVLNYRVSHPERMFNVPF